MKHILILLTILALTLILTSCDNITEPDNLAIGGRSYEWKVDTVLTDPYNGGYADLGKILGSSSQHLWYLNANMGQLWEYKAGQWARVNFVGFYPEYAVSIGSKLVVISQDLRYCVFNGATFDEARTMGVSGDIRIRSVIGNNTADVYAVGYKYENSIQKGVLLHYNGAGWSVTETGYVGSFAGVYKGSNSGILINYESTFSDGGILEFDGSGFKRIARHNYYNVIMLGGEIYFGEGNQVYKYKEGKIYFWKSFSSMSSQYIFGRSESDLFYMSGYGLLHYNGRDVAILYPIYSPALLDCKIIEGKVCCLIYNYGSQQVQLIKGTLK
jgi:hypothetical protein